MQPLLDFYNRIDIVFAIIILVGGRYFGTNFITISKNVAINFLLFSIAFAIAWIGIKVLTGDFKKSEIENLFITFLFVTSFYQLLAKKLFEKIEDWINKK